MGGKSSAPEPTDPRETSAASTGTNVATAIANSFLQNMDEITPDGTRTFTQTGDYTFTDPYTGETYTVPRFTVETQLSENGQLVHDQNSQTELNLATLAADQSGFLNDYMAEPFSYNPGTHENWAMGLYDQLNSDHLSGQRESLEARLANQGIGLGSEAYNEAMQNLETAQGNSRNQFLLDSYGTGINTALTERNQPINEIIGLMSGAQVQQPQFASGVGVGAVPTTDNGAIIGNYDNQRMNAWMQNQAAQGSFYSGLGGLFRGVGSLGLF